MESTTPLQNVWTISRMAKTESALANMIYSSVSPFFTVYFTVVRCIVGPWLAWKLASFHLAGKADVVIPYWMASSWMVTVISALFGSTIWVYKLWTGLIRFYAKRGTPKGKLGAQKEEKKDIAAAAGKLAKCQETILVLSKKLKALACPMDSMEFPYEAEKRSERDQRYELDAPWSPHSQSASWAIEPENISTTNGRGRASEWTSESGLVAPDLYKVNVPDSPIVDYLDGRLTMHTYSDTEESSPAGSPMISTQQRNKFTCFSSGSEFPKCVKTYGGESPTSSSSSSSLASTFFSKLRE